MGILIAAPLGRALASFALGRLDLASAVGARGEIVVTAEGPAVDPPSLPPALSSPILAQLRAGTGACWQSEHASAAANTATKFLSKTGAP